MTAEHTFTIRTMTMEDYDAVYQLWISTPGMGLNDLDDSREGIGRFLKRNPDTCFVAVKKDHIVGAIMSGHDGRRGYIYHTAVQEPQQRQGIGGRLLDAVFQAMEREGINKLGLVVFARNEKGNQFWEKCGFAARGDLIYRNKGIRKLKRMDT